MLFFDEKSLNFEKFGINSSQKTRIEQFSNSPLSLEIKLITLELRIFLQIIVKQTRIRSKITKM